MRRLGFLLWFLSGMAFVEAAPVHLCGKEGQRVYVIVPNLGARLPGESDADAYDRLVQETIAANAYLQDEPCHAIDSSELPPTRQARTRWRMKGKAVEVAPAP